MIATTMNRWENEAEWNFARRGREGVKMHRELWANGSVMVGHDGARSNQMIHLERAIEIYKAGWKVSN